MSPMEFVIRIEADYDSKLHLVLYSRILRECAQFIPYFISVHDYGDYICEHFERSWNEILKEMKIFKKTLRDEFT